MLKSKGKTCMAEEPSHVKQLSLNHVCNIGLKSVIWHNPSRLESGEERCGRAQEQLRGMLVGGEAAGRARWAALEQGPLAYHAHTLAGLHQREPKINKTQINLAFSNIEFHNRCKGCTQK